MKNTTLKKLLRVVIFGFLLTSGFFAIRGTNAVSLPAPLSNLGSSFNENQPTGQLVSLPKVFVERLNISRVDILDTSKTSLPIVTLSKRDNSTSINELDSLFTGIATLKNKRYLGDLVKAMKTSRLVPNTCEAQVTRTHYQVSYKNDVFEFWKTPGMRKQELERSEFKSLCEIFNRSPYIRQLSYSFYLDNPISEISTVVEVWHVHKRAEHTLEDFLERDFSIDETRKIAADLLRIVKFFYENQIDPVPFVTLNNIVFESMDNFANKTEQVLRTVDLRYSIKRISGEILSIQTKRALEYVGDILQVISGRRYSDQQTGNIVFRCFRPNRISEKTLFRSAELSDLIERLKASNTNRITPGDFLSHYFITGAAMNASSGLIDVPKNDTFGKRSSCDIVDLA